MNSGTKKDKQREEKILHPRIRLNGSPHWRTASQNSGTQPVDGDWCLGGTGCLVARHGEDLEGAAGASGRYRLIFIPYWRARSRWPLRPNEKPPRLLEGHQVSYADQVLKNEIGAIKAKPLGLNEHSQSRVTRRLTGDWRATSHASVPYARVPFVPLRMMRSTAQFHIRLLRSEGKLENVGKLNQPIYVPCTG